jgi:hypothetical protein
MGYEVRIVRDDEFDPIKLEEWIEYVRNDPGMAQEEKYEISIPGGATHSHSEPGLASWRDHPNLKAGQKCWFSFRHGQISVTRPDGPVIEKMKQIAGKLGAVVRGEEDEEY